MEQALSGKANSLKEHTIGIEVFDRRPDYDPRIDPIVRVEARRLRTKLKAYYNSHGRSDELVIELPKGGYVPSFKPPAPAKTPRPAANGEKSITVLPFANLTPEAGDDYFSDGLAEELIHLLTRIPHFRVVAWETPSQLRGRDQDLARIRQQLKIGSTLRGSVRWFDGRVRVTAQLIDAESGAYLWSEAFDRQLQDVFAIQEQIARAIVDTLELKLQPRSLREGIGQPMGLKCHHLCLQEWFHSNQRACEGLTNSIACFEQAIAVEPTCAVAYASIAEAYSLLADHGFLNPAEAAEAACAATVERHHVEFLRSPQGLASGTNEELREAARKLINLEPARDVAQGALAEFDQTSGSSHQRGVALRERRKAFDRRILEWQWRRDSLALLPKLEEVLVELSRLQSLAWKEELFDPYGKPESLRGNRG